MKVRATAIERTNERNGRNPEKLHAAIRSSAEMDGGRGINFREKIPVEFHWDFYTNLAILNGYIMSEKFKGHSLNSSKCMNTTCV